jgi:hypothetical protein
MAKARSLQVGESSTEVFVSLFFIDVFAVYTTAVWRQLRMIVRGVYSSILRCEMTVVVVRFG